MIEKTKKKILFEINFQMINFESYKIFVIFSVITIINRYWI
jgi:hypothetical protein